MEAANPLRVIPHQLVGSHFEYVGYGLGVKFSADHVQVPLFGKIGLPRLVPEP